MTILKLLSYFVGVLFIGFLFYDAIYVIAPGSLHGRYAVCYEWQHWRLEAQPLTMQLAIFSGEACPAAAVCKSRQPLAVTIGRDIQIGPMVVTHEE